MWPFGKKVEVLGFEVPTQPPARIGEVRGAHARQVNGPIVFEGPFPLANEDGFYICKQCGVPFDSWNLPSALNGLLQSLLAGKPNTCMFIINCRKCSHFNVFSPKDVITGKRGDPTGPWAAEEIARIEPSFTVMLRMTPEEIRSLKPEILPMVLFLYR